MITTNSLGKRIAKTDEQLAAFWRWFSPSPRHLADELSETEVDRLKGEAQALSDFSKSQTGLPKSHRFRVVPSTVFGHMAGVVSNRKILNAVVRSLPIDVVDFFRRKKAAPQDALHDAAMLKKVFAVGPGSDISLGIDPARSLELTARVVANAAAKITGLTGGSIKANAAMLADIGDPVLGAHVERSPHGDLGYMVGFGDSKVVDKRGRPQVVYHGVEAATADFSVFRPSKTGALGPGIYATSDRKVANDCTGAPWKRQTPGQRIYPLYVRLLTPFTENGRSQNMWDTFNPKREQVDDVEVHRRMVAAGYDGIIGVGGAPNVAAGKGQVDVVVFSPGQVKSAIGNRGTFDPSDPVITNPRVTLRPAPRLSKAARRQLQRGIAVEMEHTRSRKAARTIAAQHLAESPRYYQALERMERRLRRNPLLGNTGMEFKQNAARKLLILAIRHEGQNPDAADDLFAQAFVFAKSRWEAHHNRILPHREWPALRLESTLQLAKMVASGQLRGSR